MLANCLELNSKGQYQSSGKEKESCCLRFPALTKPEIGTLISRYSRATTAKKCAKKRDARAKFLFCYYKPMAFFCRSSCRRRRRCSRGGGGTPANFG